MNTTKEHFHGSDLEKIEKVFGIKKESITSFGANVNPLGISPMLRKNLAAHIDAITSYPDREYTDLRNAISILRESKKLDPDDSRMQRKYSELLIHMYDQSGQMQDYKQELMHFISSFWQNDLGYLLKLKEIMDGEEWIDYRENILEKMNGKFDRYELLAEEGLYERLMKEIMEEDFIYSMDRYEKVLKKRFPKKVRDVYLSYVQEQAKVVSNRKAYGKLMWYLKKLRTYPDGERITMEIAKEWKMKFRRRPAMMDELRKAGF